MVAAVRSSCGAQSSAWGLMSRSGSPALANENSALTFSRSAISQGAHQDLSRYKAIGQPRCAQIPLRSQSGLESSLRSVSGAAGVEDAHSLSRWRVCQSPLNGQQTGRINPVVLLKGSFVDQGVKSSQGALINKRRLSTRARATESNLTVERPGIQKQRDQRQMRQSGTIEKKKEIYKSLEDSPSKVERCVIVDEDNNVVGEASRADTVGNRLWGRGVYCLVQNTRGQLLVTQRTEEKDLYPGHLDVVVSGCVNVGEEYSDTIERELSEELGLKTVDRSSLAPLFLFKWVDEYCRIWGCGYHYVTDCETFDLQVEEVQWCKWMDLDDVEKLIQTARFTPVGLFVLRRFLRERQSART